MIIRQILLFTEGTARLEQSVSSLDTLIAEVGKYVDDGKTHAEAPHIIDVVLPFLCSYLPTWWHKGPDNVDPKGGSHITMVTTDHMNQVLKISHVKIIEIQLYFFNIILMAACNVLFFINFSY